MSDFNLYSINWQDGMLLTQEHLRSQERYAEELARRYGTPIGDRWGLIRFGASSRLALTLNAVVNGDRLRIELAHCQAITPDGYVIHISQADGQPVRTTVAATEGEIPVFVSINPDAKVETGNPDPSEEIPRMPFRAAAYVLHAGNRPEIPAGRIVPIATLVVHEKEVRLSPTYFPPCVTLFSDEQLNQKAGELRNRLETLLSIGNRAYQTLSGEGSDLKADLKETIYQFVSYLSSTLDDFVVGRNAGHPLMLLAFHKKLFRTFQTLLNLRPGVRDYLHDRYFVKEAQSDISRFMSQIDDFLMTEYNHENIGGHVRSIETLLDLVKGLLGYMAHVKEEQLGPQAMATESLTYRGKTYKQSPYGQTRVEQLGDLTYLEILLTDPRSMKDLVVLLSKNAVAVTDWTAMHVRLGLNEARGLGETDPVAVDTTSYGDKVALHPHDMLQSQSVRKLTLIFRGIRDASAFQRLTGSDLIVYAV